MLHHKWFLQSCMGLMILMWHSGNAQFITEPDPSVNFDKSTGIIVLYSKCDGSFYMNDHFLTEIKKNDTIYLANAISGNYSARFVSLVSTKEQKFILDTLTVANLILDCDSIYYTKGNEYEWYNTAHKIAGKTIFFGKKKNWGEILHLGRKMF